VYTLAAAAEAATTTDGAATIYQSLTHVSQFEGISFFFLEANKVFVQL
jgi:hypothetical protein